MGYTHYWNAKKTTNEQWTRLVYALNEGLFPRVDTICKEYDEETVPPLATDRLVQFNGKGDAGHETLWIERGATGFQFCKTAHKPYDTAVCATLIYCASILGWKVSSDGDASDWQRGLNLAHTVWPHIRNRLKIPAGVISPDND